MDKEAVTKYLMEQEAYALGFAAGQDDTQTMFGVLGIFVVILCLYSGWVLGKIFK